MGFTDHGSGTRDAGNRPLFLKGQMGKQLAQFWLRLLFEQDQVAAMHTVWALVAVAYLKRQSLSKHGRKAQPGPIT
ncbi:MAG: hypothetical protein IPH40_03955 [Polaromonas sp.]|nr:hypothetical protein [Polaromonas sp.]